MGKHHSTLKNLFFQFNFPRSSSNNTIRYCTAKIFFLSCGKILFDPKQLIFLHNVYGKCLEASWSQSQCKSWPFPLTWEHLLVLLDHHLADSANFCEIHRGVIILGPHLHKQMSRLVTGGDILQDGHRSKKKY